MITELKIKNFRCFNELALDELKPLTLLTGKNNVGKSTVLEALFLLLGFRTPTVFFKLNYFRGLAMQHLDPDTLWGSLFYGSARDKPFSVSAKVAERFYSVDFEKEQGKFAVFQGPPTNKTPADFTHGTPIECLKYTYSRPDGSEGGLFVVTSDGVQIMQSGQAPFKNDPLKKAIMKNTRTDLQVAEAFSTVDLEGKKESVIEVLRHIDDRIRDVSLVMRNNAGMLYADIGMKGKIPVTAMGDGINNLLLVILMILTTPGGVVLLDEIETGFHYSALKDLWSLIAEFAKREECQIIATTHSYECIASALAAVKAGGREEDFAVTRLDRRGDSISATAYSGDILDFALNQEVEVR